jgi:hypothetical protein
MGESSTAQARAGHAHTTKVHDLGQLNTAVPCLEGTDAVLECILEYGRLVGGQVLGLVGCHCLRQLAAAQARAGHAHTTEVHDLGQLNTAVPCLEGTDAVLECILEYGRLVGGQVLGLVGCHCLLQLTAFFACEGWRQ